MRRAIAAIDNCRGIATDAGIPWDVPADRAYFREMTAGSTVLMGAVTYQEMDAPLPARRNLVATRGTEPLRIGFEVVRDVATLLTDPVEDIWVIGGAGLYAATMTWMDELYLTRIPGDYGCTKFFPPFDDTFTEAQARPADGAPGVEFEVWARSGA